MKKNLTLLNFLMVYCLFVICHSTNAKNHDNDTLTTTNAIINPYLLLNSTNKQNYVFFDIGTYIKIDNSLYGDISFRSDFKSKVPVLGLGFGVKMNIKPIKKYLKPLLFYKLYFAPFNANTLKIHEFSSGIEITRFKFVRPIIKFGYWLSLAEGYYIAGPIFSIGFNINLITK